MCRYDVKLVTGGSDRNSGDISVVVAPPPTLPPQVSNSFGESSGNKGASSVELDLKSLLDDDPQINFLEGVPPSANNNDQGLMHASSLASDEAFWEDLSDNSPSFPSSVAFKSLGLYEYSMYGRFLKSLLHVPLCLLCLSLPLIHSL